MTAVKYMLHPGYIRSKNDNDRHYIGVQALSRLYKVPLKQCVVYDTPNAIQYSHGRDKKLIHLYPRYSGDYTTIPKPEECT